MEIIAEYSFNGGSDVVPERHLAEYNEICAAIREVDAEAARIKTSREATMPGKLLYSPIALNRAILDERLYKRGWSKPTIRYSTEVAATASVYRGFIEADGEKNGLGLEVQFGKYAFLGWDILGKMPIFAQRHHFRAAVEVVPMASFRRRGQMSSGIGCFEQIKAMLELRGVGSVDIPVLVLGIAPDNVTSPGARELAEEEDANLTGE